MSGPVEYPLYRRVGKGSSKVRVQVGVALVDDWAVEYLDNEVGARRSWNKFHAPRDSPGNYYAKTSLNTYVNGKWRTVMIMMHTFLLRLVDPKGEHQRDGLVRHAEHIDRNPLNNTIANLRWATPSENQANTGKSKMRCKYSKYKGVNWERKSQTHPWVAKIGHKGKILQIGFFKTQEDAARAYNEAALKLYREFAVLNVIEQEVTA